MRVTGLIREYVPLGVEERGPKDFVSRKRVPSLLEKSIMTIVSQL